MVATFTLTLRAKKPAIRSSVSINPNISLESSKLHGSGDHWGEVEPTDYEGVLKLPVIPGVKHYASGGLMFYVIRPKDHSDERPAELNADGCPYPDFLLDEGRDYGDELPEHGSDNFYS